MIVGKNSIFPKSEAAMNLILFSMSHLNHKLYIDINTNIPIYQTGQHQRDYRQAVARSPDRHSAVSQHQICFSVSTWIADGSQGLAICLSNRLTAKAFCRLYLKSR